ncbi:MAG: cytidine deaminase [Nanoarchaeota archaeon]
MKLTKKDKELIEKAKEVIKKAKPLKKKDFGEVGSALITSKENIYTGVSTGFFCGMASCGEYQAMGAMLSNGEKEIDTIVAIEDEGIIMPPCGKCREMIYQCDKKNLNTWVIISKSKKVKLKELLPHRWEELFSDLR